MGGLFGFLGGLANSFIQSKSADKATAAQVGMSDAAIEEQRRQFDAMQSLLNPYVEAGTGALNQQQALTGLLGPEAQQEAIAGIQSSPEFAAITQQGENAILQSAAATGGLRGGNTQGALAQFRPQVLSGLINQRFGQLGGLSAQGQASAAGVGAAGINTGQNIAQQFGIQGQALAGNALAQGQAQQGVVNAGVGFANSGQEALISALPYII
jgi:hypothetical protein